MSDEKIEDPIGRYLGAQLLKAAAEEMVEEATSALEEHLSTLNEEGRFEELKEAMELLSQEDLEEEGDETDNE